MRRKRGVVVLTAAGIFAGIWGYGNHASARLSPGEVVPQRVTDEEDSRITGGIRGIGERDRDADSSECGGFRAAAGKDLPLSPSDEIDDPMAGQMNLLYDTVDAATRDEAGANDPAVR